MRNLGAVEAANAIRNDVFNTPGIDPEEQHQIRYVQSVCDQLGLDPSPDNMHKVALALHKHDIGLHRGDEYPKMAVRKHDRAQKVVQDEHDAHSWENEPPPEPQEPVGRLVEEPVQDLSIDNQNRVPVTLKPNHPAGRAPDAQTNAAARQEPYVMGGEADPAHDYNPSSADVHTEELLGEAHTEEHHVDDHTDVDDEVHVEEPSPAPAPKPSRKRPQ